VAEGCTQADEVLAEYLVRIDRGEPVDREAFVAAQPEVADQLRAYFADSQAVRQTASCRWTSRVT
jgi:hypothetical protein